MRVLFVEDHTDTRSVLSMLLARCGCQTVVTAKNMKEARQRLEEMPFEVLISDLTLPDGDGIDLVRFAKQTQPLKAIAVTGRHSEDDRKAGLAAGFDHYFAKPIDLQELRRALGR